MRTCAALAIVLLAIAASLTGISNGFALDDVEIIVRNERVHSLAGAWRIFVEPYWPPDFGASLYRPFTVLAFAVQWLIGGGSPLPFHVTSILVYALCSVAVFRLCEEIVDWPVAWLAAALFAVHPVHVEAVANVVGQAELWAALLSIIAATRFIRVRKRGELRGTDVTTIAALYGAALMFKEHVIVLPVILALLGITVTGRGPVVTRLRGMSPILGATALVAVCFVAVRTAVIGDLQGGGVSPLFAEQDFSARFFTMLRVVMEWIRLFFWPADLAADYSFSRIVLAHQFEADMLPGAAVLLATVVIAIQLRRNLPAITIGAAWTGITLLIPSNLFVVTGFVLAERTLFFPSVGVVLVVAVAVDRVTRAVYMSAPGARQMVVAAVTMVLVLGVARSSTRNVVWRNNDSLFAQTVEDAPRSARAHMMLAQWYIDRGAVRNAVAETTLALLVGSKSDSQLFAFSGDIFHMSGKCDLASRLYVHSLALRRDQPRVRLNAAICRDISARSKGSSTPGERWLVRIAQVPDSMLVLPTQAIIARAARQAGK
ncbi:MAG: hypothetical protein ACSLFK_07090 [Gemmatimonadaceae bacterium]